MIIYSIVLILFSNAVTLRRDKSILYSRVAIISLLYSFFIQQHIFYMLPPDLDLYFGDCSIDINSCYRGGLFFYLYRIGRHILFNTSQTLKYRLLLVIKKASLVNRRFFSIKNSLKLLILLLFRGVAIVSFFNLNVDLQISFSIILGGMAIETYDAKKQYITKTIKNIKDNPFFIFIVYLERLLFITCLIIIFVNISTYFTFLELYIVPYLQISFIKEIFQWFIFPRLYLDELGAKPKLDILYLDRRPHSRKIGIPLENADYRRIVREHANNTIYTTTELEFIQFRNEHPDVVMPASSVWLLFCPDTMRRDTDFYFLHNSKKVNYRSNSFHDQALTLHNDQSGTSIVVEALPRPSLDNLFYAKYEDRSSTIVGYEPLTYETTNIIHRNLFVKTATGNPVNFPFSVKSWATFSYKM